MNNDPKDPRDPGNQPKKGFPKFKRTQSITLWIVILLFLIIAYNMYMRQDDIKTVTYSEFIAMAEQGSIVRAVFNDRDVQFWNLSNQKFQTHMPYDDPTLIRDLAKKVNISSQKPSKFLAILVGWLPFLVFIGFWIFMMRSMQGGGNKAFSFGKSRARLFVGGKTNKTFKDVAGVDEAKEELEEIVEYLKAPAKFQRLGGRIPRGVLLLGRPGTGKTLLAKAVAGEAGVPFFSISGSDFVEMFVGVGASRVRDLFEQAKRNAPCIAFIDEIDAVGRHRGTGLGGGHDEREQTLNQLLVEMDGFEANDSVIIIAATNRADVLDPALLRPGRFDRQVIVDLPDILGREEILKVHVRKLPISDNVNLKIIARATPGFSGADLANLVNEAALMAARRNRKKIEMDDFEEARDKETLGKERKSKVISEEEKKITAYHEVGHVLCSIFQEKTDTLHKVTIIPRGLAGGVTQYLGKDRMYYTKGFLEQRIVMSLGGRAAEELKFGEITTGASSDIEYATYLARKMVTKWGMSDNIGPMAIGKEDSQVFLGKELTQRESVSEHTATSVDAEIRGLIMNAYETARKILEEHMDVLEKMSEALLDKETLNLEEIFEIILETVEGEEKESIKKKFESSMEMRMSDERTDDKEHVEDDVESKFESTEEQSDGDASSETPGGNDDESRD